jgi:hypothetical protein
LSAVATVLFAGSVEALTAAAVGGNNSCAHLEIQGLQVMDFESLCLGRYVSVLPLSYGC